MIRKKALICNPMGLCGNSRKPSQMVISRTDPKGSGQFTLSLHYFFQKSPKNHLDLFLDRDGVSPLDTFRCYYAQEKKSIRGGLKKRNFLGNSIVDESARGQHPWIFTQINPHRRAYLDYAGEIKENRGRVRILRKGKFIDMRKKRHDRMQVRL